MIDLRSDTLTKPTAGMRRALAAAEVGDDVYAEDPTVRALEERVAAMFGHEAAVFTPTGSMANVLAVAAVVAPGQEVLCDAAAHIVRAELGAHGALTGVTTRTWVGSALDLATLEELIAVDLGHLLVATAAISVENTHNFRGGRVIDLVELRRLRALGDERGLAVHLDGARIWNAHVATGTPLTSYGEIADVLAVCLSKGLGAPAGSLMIGPADLVAQARVRRKRMGGSMRQVGVLAAAGLWALDHHLDRLAEDHEHARLLAAACGLDPAEVDTNIVVLEVPDAQAFVDRAAEHGVRVGALGPRTVRLLTHLDVTRPQVDRAAAALARIMADL